MKLKSLFYQAAEAAESRKGWKPKPGDLVWFVSDEPDAREDRYVPATVRYYAESGKSDWLGRGDFWPDEQSVSAVCALMNALQAYDEDSR